MYGLLLALGAVITTAGLALVASGASAEGHAFDAAKLTPGAIAVTGGCIIIGLAFVFRALTRVEQALSLRSMPRPARPAAPPNAMASAEPDGTPSIPFPSKPKPAYQPSPLPAMSALSAAGGAAPGDRLRERAPPVERLESTPIVDDGDISLLPRETVRVEARNGEHKISVNSPASDEAATARAASRSAANPRPMRGPPPAKVSIFESLWPRAQRPETETRHDLANASQPVPSRSNHAAAAAEPSPRPPLRVQQERTPGVSILKSGVVEGMAYTLYSDGSIEALLPQGTLRFGSITELRNHIEQHPQA